MVGRRSAACEHMHETHKHRAWACAPSPPPNPPPSGMGMWSTIPTAQPTTTNQRYVHGAGQSPYVYCNTFMRSRRAASAAAARAARSTASAPSAAVLQVAAARAVAVRVAVGKVVARGDSGWQGGVDSGDGGDDDGGGGGGGGSEGGDVPLNLRAGMGQSQPRWSQAGSAMRGLCESGYSSSECAL